MDLVDIYRIFHPTATKYTFFSASQGTFFKMNILEPKASLNKYKKTEETSCILSDHNRIKLEIKNKRIGLRAWLSYSW
jgi:hypothetical protein